MSRKKDKGRGGVDESGHEDGKDQAVEVNEVQKIAEKVAVKEEKGKKKEKGKGKMKDSAKGDKGDAREEKESTGDPKANEGRKSLSGAKALETVAKDEKGKEKGSNVRAVAEDAQRNCWIFGKLLFADNE